MFISEVMGRKEINYGIQRSISYIKYELQISIEKCTGRKKRGEIVLVAW